MSERGIALRIAAWAIGLLACVSSAVAVAAAEPRVALVIGNGAYGEIGPLANPVNDARLMADALRELGFEVLVRTDADQTAMKRAIQEFGGRLEAAGRDAVGLFYYAGHGLQVRGDNYLVPVSARIQREADVEIEAVNAGWVLQQMDWAGNRLNFLVLDACRNNPLSRGFRSADRGLARMDAPRGTMIAYSTAPGSVAADGAGANSPYTTALAAAIREPGVVAEEVFRRVRVSVLRDTGDAQVPWESSSLTGAFYFTEPPPAAAPTAATDRPPPATPSPPPAAPPVVDGRAVELALWDSVKDSRNPAAFEEYLRQFPDGAFAGIARLRLAELSGQGAAESGGPTTAGDPMRRFEVAALDMVLYTQKRANVRALPAPEAERLATLEPGEEVQVTGRVEGVDWYQIRTPGTATTAFVWAPLLGETRPARERSEAPAAPPSGGGAAAAKPTPVAIRPPGGGGGGDIVGRWEGRYSCQEDSIGMALDITRRGGSEVAGTFEFFALPGSPSFPRGKFAVSGVYDPAGGGLQLRSGSWIERPLGFQSHSLEGRLEGGGSTINGRILTTGCTHFTVTRR